MTAKKVATKQPKKAADKQAQPAKAKAKKQAARDEAPAREPRKLMPFDL